MQVARSWLDVPMGVYHLVATEGAAEPPREIQILPYGLVKSQRGDFLVDDESVRLVLEHFARHINDLVIDYEHQTLADVEAPAAGWIKRLIDRGTDGVWAEVEWTPRATEYLNNREYRYLSPVVGIRRSDNRAIYIHSAALTNVPAIDGMVPVIANNQGVGPEEEENNMEILARLRDALALDSAADDNAIVQAVTALKAKADAATEVVANKEILAMLELEEVATVDQVKGKILALKNPSGYVSAQQYNELKARLDDRDAEDLVELALTSGKIAPASKEWLKEYALKDPAGAKAFVESAPQVVPLGKIARAENPGASSGPEDDAQAMVCKSLGVTAEQVAKWNGGDQ